jgi:hypothetical protein
VSFGVKTALTGVRRLIDVPYLHPTSGAIPVSIEAPPYVAVPMTYELRQNYPNPFNPTTTIEFELPTEAVVTLTVYNVLGQQVTTLLDHQLLEDGEQQVEFDAANYASGMYLYRITAQPVSTGDGAPAQTFTTVRKMMLLK